MNITVNSKENSKEGQFFICGSSCASFHSYSNKGLAWLSCLWTVENSVLLKCRNSEEKTRRLRIRSSAEFLYSMTCVVICSHRRSHLKSFLQGIFIVRIGGGTFFRLRQNIKAEGNKPNESTSGQDKVICRIKVQSLSSHWSHWQKAQLSQAQMVRKQSQTPLPCPTPLSQDVNSNQT